MSFSSAELARVAPSHLAKDGPEAAVMARLHEADLEALRRLAKG